jgi:hypothetical protein
LLENSAISLEQDELRRNEGSSFAAMLNKEAHGGGGSNSAAEEFLGGSFCARQGAGAISCLVQTLEYWQTIYVDALQRTFSSPPGRFTGMNILGAVQQASGVPGASVGHPATSAGSKCEWMTACVHPTYGTPAATAVGKAMWDLWLKNSSFERSSQA